MSLAKILWVDDEMESLRSQIMFLENKGYEVESRSNGYDALDYVKDNEVDVVLLDESMPGITGLETLQKIKELKSTVPIVLITKNETENLMNEAIGSQITDYLIKPVNPNQVWLSLKKIIDNRRLVAERTTSAYQQQFRNLFMELNNNPDYNQWMEIYKIINDPVYGFITIDNALVFEVISHPFYQRLRRIHQMALAHLVYPGAVHSRLHHSLGSYHLMSNAINELRSKGFDISHEEEIAAKIAILLHDIGHGPFSHALEHTLIKNLDHEEVSLLLMKQMNKEMGNSLEMAISIFTNEYPKKFLHQLVSGQLDVDRMDYLTRDSFFTGVSEGVIGYDRILKMLTVTKVN